MPKKTIIVDSHAVTIQSGERWVNQSPFHVACSPKYEIFSFLTIQLIKKHKFPLKLHMLKYIVDYWRVPKKKVVSLVDVNLKNRV